jgi:hypothetical protein
MMIAAGLVTLVTPPVLADSLPASQAAVAYGDIAVVERTDWQPILAKAIKTPNHKGLGVYVSLECGLTTKTDVASKNGRKETSAVEAGVEVRVMVDGEYAEPGPVTFCRRNQTLSATLGGILADLSTDDPNDSCLFLEEIDVDGDGTPDETVVKIDTDCVTPEEIELLLDTMAAHSYFFYYADAAPGVHMVTVDAKIDTQAGADGESTSVNDQQATATLGHGSMGINVIRLIHGDDGTTLELE